MLNLMLVIVPIIQLVQPYKVIKKVLRRFQIQHTKSGPLVPQNVPTLKKN